LSSKTWGGSPRQRYLFSTMNIEAEKKKLFLDPEIDKIEVEKNIIKRIEEQLPDCDHDEVVHAVEVEYEELLATARLKAHLPCLVEKLAKEDVRNHIPPGHHGE